MILEIIEICDILDSSFMFDYHGALEKYVRLRGPQSLPIVLTCVTCLNVSHFLNGVHNIFL